MEFENWNYVCMLTVRNGRASGYTGHECRNLGDISVQAQGKQLRPVTASGVEPFGDSNGRSKSCECALSASNRGLV